jgi:hypothetical protein
MALISCPECNRQISDRAANCIHCGFPMPNQTAPKSTVHGPSAHAGNIPSSGGFRQGFAAGRSGVTFAPAKLPVRQITPAAVASPAAVDVAQAVREGATQAENNKNAASLWFLQVLVVAGIAGFAATSWAVFGGVLLTLSVLIHVPYLGKMIGLAMAVAFGWGIYEVGKHLGSPQAGAVIGGLVGLAFAAGNVAVRQYGKDLNAGLTK